MGQRSSGIRPLTLVSVLAAWVLFASAMPFAASIANADPLGEVTESVKEATAPVSEAVGTAIPPVVTPEQPAAETPSPVKIPESQLPEVPVKVPPVSAPEAPATADSHASIPAVGETVRRATGAAAETLTNAAGAVATAANDEGVEATSADSPGAGRLNAAAGSDASGPTAAGIGPADAIDPSGMPARLMHPFIHVWPALALTAERALDDFVGHWSRSMLALFEPAETGSAPGASGALAGSAPDPEPVSHASGQPPFDWFSTPSLSPFDLVAGEAALPVFVFLLVLAASTAALLVAMRQRLGAPLLPRRITRWRR